MTNDGFNFQASVKDSDGDMVNVRADSVAELESNLLNFPSGAYAQFKANVRGGSSLGQMVQPQQAAPPTQQQWQDSAPAAQPTWSQPQQQAPAPQGARLHPEGKTCRCGNVLNFKEVSRKSDGKRFQFWECPARTGSKDTQHISEFAN